MQTGLAACRSGVRRGSSDPLSTLADAVAALRTSKKMKRTHSVAAPRRRRDRLVPSPGAEMRLTPKAHETASKKRDLALRTGPRRERPRAAFCRARDVEKESRTPPTTASISCPFPPRRRSPRGPSAPSPAKARRRGPSPATSSSARPRPSASTATRRSRRAPRTRRPSGNARSFVRTLRCPSRGASQRSDAANMILNGFRPPRYVPAAPADVVDALLATAPAPARPVAAASPKQPAPSAEFRARVREPSGSFEAAPS